MCILMIYYKANKWELPLKSRNNIVIPQKPTYPFPITASLLPKGNNCSFFFILTFYCVLRFNSVQFSRSVVSNSLRPYGLQHTRPPCPSPAPGIYSNSSPSSQWCHPTISSSVFPFSTCLHPLPASESFLMSQLCIGSPRSPRDS